MSITERNALDSPLRPRPDDHDLDLDRAFRCFSYITQTIAQLELLNRCQFRVVVISPEFDGFARIAPNAAMID